MGIVPTDDLWQSLMGRTRPLVGMLRQRVRGVLGGGPLQEIRREQSCRSRHRSSVPQRQVPHPRRNRIPTRVRVAGGSAGGPAAERISPALDHNGPTRPPHARDHSNLRPGPLRSRTTRLWTAVDRPLACTWVAPYGVQRGRGPTFRPTLRPTGRADSVRAAISARHESGR